MSARILLIEADPVSRRMVRGCLEGHGYQVGDVQEAASAINMLRAEPFDVVLIAFRLDDLDALVAARSVRNMTAELVDRPKIAGLIDSFLEP